MSTSQQTTILIAKNDCNYYIKYKKQKTPRRSSFAALMLYDKCENNLSLTR